MNSKNVPPCPRSQVSGCLVASDNDNYKDSDKSTEFAARALTIAKCFLSNDQQRLATRLRGYDLTFLSLQAIWAKVTQTQKQGQRPSTGGGRRTKASWTETNGCSESGIQMKMQMRIQTKRCQRQH